MADYNYRGKLKRKRSANWDNTEKSLLRNCVKEFIPIVENKNTDANMNKSKIVAWQAVTQRFNELNNRKRDFIELRQQWRTMKLEAKKDISQIKLSMQCRGGPKPPDPSPETKEVFNILPKELETNAFDNDATKNEKVCNSTLELVLTPMIKPVNEDENIRPHTSDFQPYKITSGVKRQMPINDYNRPTQTDKEFAQERNDVLINCLREEHEIKVKNMIEAHSFITEEHNLKMKQMLEAHNLFKEEANLRIEKLKLDIFTTQLNNVYEKSCEK